jgi:hypothetical protein
MPFDLTPLERGVLYTRPELAALWGYQGYQAFARGVFTPRMARTIVLFVTREKQVGLTAYRDMLVGDHLTWEGEAGHSTDERIATAAERGESIVLFYRDVHHTPFRYHGEVLLTRFSQRRDEPSRFEFQLVHDLSAFDDLRAHSNELGSLPSTEREQITKARVGQGRFRDDLLRFWNGCAVTGVDRSDLVRASHIKPWRLSDNAERLDPHNGLLLLPQYDHLFDAGYISFDDDGRLVESPAIADLNPSVLGFDLSARLRRMTDGHREFLEFHRRHLFLRSA